MAAFDDISDFRLADATRLRPGELAMSVLPEKSGTAQNAVSLKDVAFLYEAAIERRMALGMTESDAKHGLNNGVVIPRPVATSGLFFAELVAPVSACLRRDWTFNPTTGRYDDEARLYNFYRLAPSALDGYIHDRYDAQGLRVYLPDDYIGMMLGWRTDPESGETVCRSLIPPPAAITRDRPLPYAADLVRSLYYATLHANGAMTSASHTAVVVLSRTFVAQRRYTGRTRFRNSAGVWTELAPTVIDDTTRTLSASSWCQRTTYDDGSAEEHSYVEEILSYSGAYELTVPVRARPVAAYVCFVGSTDYVNPLDSRSPHGYDKVLVMRLGEPDQYSEQDGEATWMLDSQYFGPLYDSLPQETVDLDGAATPQSGSETLTAYSSKVVNLDMGIGTQVRVFVKYGFRTGLEGGTSAEWTAWRPDASRTLP